MKRYNATIAMGASMDEAIEEIKGCGGRDIKILEAAGIVSFNIDADEVPVVRAAASISSVEEDREMRET